MAVKVPKEVYKAFEEHKKMWANMSDESINLMFLAIPYATVHDQSLILKNYAQRNPTKYIQALANGYELEINIHDELEEMITTWLNKPYVGDEKRDVKNFTRMVIKHLQKNG